MIQAVHKPSVPSQPKGIPYSAGRVFSLAVGSRKAVINHSSCELDSSIQGSVNRVLAQWHSSAQAAKQSGSAPEEKVFVDLGCGYGNVAYWAAVQLLLKHIPGQVIGLELNHYPFSGNDSMFLINIDRAIVRDPVIMAFLAVVEANPWLRNPSNLSFRYPADACDIPLQDSSVDLLLASYVFMHVHDKLKL